MAEFGTTTRSNEDVEVWLDAVSNDGVVDAQIEYTLQLEYAGSPSGGQQIFGIKEENFDEKEGDAPSLPRKSSFLDYVTFQVSTAYGSKVNDAIFFLVKEKNAFRFVAKREVAQRQFLEGIAKTLI